MRPMPPAWRRSFCAAMFYAGVALLVAGCVPIGVRVQNMLALWSG